MILVDILFGAFFIALLSLAALKIPAFIFIAGLIWAAPVVVLTRRQNVFAALGAISLGSVPLLLLSGTNQVLFVLTQFAPLAIFLGLALKNHLAPSKTILVGFIITLISTIGSFYFLMGWDLNRVVINFNQETQAVVATYKTMGYFDQLQAEGYSEEMVVKSANSMVKTFLRLIPAAIVLWSVIIALINYLVARKFLRRLNYSIPRMAGFVYWHLPWFVIWGLIIGLSCLVIPGQGGNDILPIIGGNILMVYFYTLVVLGVSVCLYFYRNLPFAPVLKSILILLVILTLPQVSFLVFACIGLIDMIIDTRAIYQSRSKGEN